MVSEVVGVGWFGRGAGIHGSEILHLRIGFGVWDVWELTQDSYFTLFNNMEAQDMETHTTSC